MSRIRRPGIRVPSGLIAWHLLLSAGVLAAASAQTWLLPVAFERLSPVPILAGLGLLAVALSEFGDSAPPSARTESQPGLRIYSASMLQIALPLALSGVAMTGRSGLALLLAGLLALSYLSPQLRPRSFDPGEERG